MYTLLLATKGQIKEKRHKPIIVRKMPIEILEIKNFKSIKHLKLQCRRVNLFIGEPNTGKSNILEAIGLLSHLGHGRINDFVRFEVMNDLFYDRVLDDPIRVGFNEKALEIAFKDGQFNGTLITQLDETKKTSSHVFRYGYDGGREKPLKAFQEFKYYQFRKRLIFSRQMSEFLNPPHADNLLAVILGRKELRTVFKNLFGKFGYRPVFKPQEGKIEILKELEDILIGIPYSLTSETLQRIVFFLAAIYSNKESILTFEEPEAHAFPYYTKYLAERIALDKNNNQYFIATHNPYLLMSILEKSLEEEVTIFVTSMEKYQTKAKALTVKQKEEILGMGMDIFFNIEKFLS